MVRTRAAAAAIAAPAVLGWSWPSAPAAGRSGEYTATAGSQLTGLDVSAVVIGSIIVALALVVFVARRLRQRGDMRGGGPAGDSAVRPGTDELAATAAHSLVSTDDAVRTSDQELGFATARCGDRATAPFLAALQSARTEMGDAFALRQRLDDGIAHETTARRYLTEIIEHCAAASRLLDERAAEFDRLQDLQARAPQAVSEVDAQVVQQSARVERLRQVLDEVAVKYTPAAVSSVATNPDEAVVRLEFAADCLARARQELAAGRSPTAARLLQSAEATADQATDLLSGIERRQAQLTQAASALPGAQRELEAEMAEAAASAADGRRDECVTLVARARDVSASVRERQHAGPFDAVAALRELQQADAALDQALAGVRGEPASRQRARPVLDEAMLVARSSVAGAEEYVETRRGGVGATARTRLAEAHRHFRQAIGRLQEDPEGALAEALESDALAQQARSLAEDDVARLDGGLAGGPGTGTRLDTAILGGILVSNGRGALGPASFGGTGTRTRHAGGLAYDQPD